MYNAAMSEGYISTADAAERLGITRQRVLQLIAHGQLPASKFANVYMILESDLRLVEHRPPGRPVKPTAPEKRTTGHARGTSDTVTGKSTKRRGRKAA